MRDASGQPAKRLEFLGVAQFFFRTLALGQIAGDSKDRLDVRRPTCLEDLPEATLWHDLRMHPGMGALRLILVAFLVLTVSWPAAAQSTRLNLTVRAEQLIPPQAPRMPVSAAMHPAAKGALIGGAAGAGLWSAIAVWYCTIGPSEVGECDTAGQWLKGAAVYGAAGAAVGAVIGAIAGRR